MAKVCGDNALGFTCAIWRCYYGKELNVRTHYMLRDNRGAPIRQSQKMKSGRNSICSETTRTKKTRTALSPTLCDTPDFSSNCLFVLIENTRNIGLDTQARTTLLRSISRHGSFPYLFLWVLQLG